MRMTSASSLDIVMETLTGLWRMKVVMVVGRMEPVVEVIGGGGGGWVVVVVGGGWWVVVSGGGGGGGR